MLDHVALRVRGLHKAWGSLVVTDNVYFDLAAGARHALIGPNGAGKTTFINLVTGELLADKGEIHLHGENITGSSASSRVKKGLIRTFQINQLFQGLSVIDNVAMAIAEREGTSWNMFRQRSRYRTQLEEAFGCLSHMNLTDKAGKLVRQLAYGEQRLLEIVIALSLKPQVLLLDEPAAGVPSGETGVVMAALNGLPKDMAVLLIEHDMELVFKFAARITVLERGRVVCEGTPQEVAADEHVKAIYFGEGSMSHG